jgi:hypothetical protein
MTRAGVPFGKVTITDLSDLAASAKGKSARKVVKRNFIAVS